jgi:hypothetical protein
MKIISNKTHKTFVIGQYKNVSFKISLKSDMEESFIEPMVRDACRYTGHNNEKCTI